ncbi:PREDICTED: 28S ribosomal protein S22, mitochondrial isoform X2 [Eufriesea mexicana]|uniref:28S ribosomal protein S22, mitochondrial isoform X2 n=1 Tax=Eufriesea mexicana TaxID=516756 RepID=UPI00083C3984|nr:PREDICTED: 28S ribosomal protein S22, mitochondrial isoform X2 [Eufriesea mexicana]
MICSRMNFVLKHVYKQPIWNCRLCSKISQENEKDPAPLFFDQHVQELLTTLTRINYDKVFATRKDGTKLVVPKYKFMTDEELKNAQVEIAVKARGRIQMPPVVKMRSDEEVVLSNDPALQGFQMHNIVVTDISFGNQNRNRLIVIREPNGKLRHAKSDERRRVNQVYFPINGREIHIPNMFYDPHFKDLLERQEFEFILDRTCTQFEPDDPEYHRITKEVYEWVNKLKKFDILRSTRHFGPFVFNLAWKNDICPLLMELITNKNIKEAAALIRLYHRLHPEAKSHAEPILDDIELVLTYAKLDSPEPHKLTRAIVNYNKLRKEEEEIKLGVIKAHGLVDDTDKQT